METLNPTYLEIPILFSGRYYFNNNVQLQVNFGPYFACGLFGKDKEEVKYNGKKETDSDNFFGDDGLKRFDAGLSLGAGVLLYRHYYIGFQYEFGLANMIPGDWTGELTDWSMKNRNFTLTVGYNF